MRYHLYVESKKTDTNELIHKNRNRLTDLETKLGYERERRDKLGAWDLHICITIYKVNNQQGPTV